MDKKRILAIEDNSVNLATLVQVLSRYYEVVPMSTGARAIKYLEKFRVDLVLLDVQMPGMSGIETLQTMRTMEYGVNVPVIFLTASKEKSTVIEGSRLGICDYIVKPFDPTKLHDRIEQAIANIAPRTIDNPQLAAKLTETVQLLATGSPKTSIVKAEEILGYEVGTDIAGRIESAKQKIKANDFVGAERILNRTIQLVNHNEQERLQESNVALNQLGIKNRLQLILSDIHNFKTEDAKEKISELISHKIPDTVFETCQKALSLLNEYDEDSAEAILTATFKSL